MGVALLLSLLADNCNVCFVMRLQVGALSRFCRGYRSLMSLHAVHNAVNLISAAPSIEEVTLEDNPQQVTNKI